jgi:hypothetical protein
MKILSRWWGFFAVALAALALAVLALAVLVGTPRQAAVFFLAEILPRSLGQKMVQGIVRYQGFDLIELDHRFGRYAAGFEDLRREVYEPVHQIETGGVRVDSLGYRFLGENPSGSFGTLLGYSVASGQLGQGAGLSFVAGGYEYGKRIAERGIVYIGSTDQAPLTRVIGPAMAGAWFGHSVAVGGDWDGDGAGDLLVGARFARQGRGAAYWLPGRLYGAGEGISGDIEVDDWPGRRRLVIATLDAQLGFSVCFGDDWDGDGRDELVVRAHLSGRESGGALVVFSGGLAAADDGDLLLDGAGVARIVSAGPYIDLGRSLALGGDWDGDGKRDLIMGAQTAPDYFSVDEKVPSRCYIAVSSRLHPGAELHQDDLIAIAEQRQGDQLGSCVGGLGDLDGDGFEEILVGARQAEQQRGAAYILSGRLIAAAARGEDLEVEQVALLKLVGEESGDLFGWSCAESAADIDGDGLPEIAVGARQAAGRVGDAGAVYVFSGASARRAILPPGQGPGVMAAAAAFKISGTRRGGRLGSKRRFAFGADIDGQGRADLAVGAPGWHEGGLFAGAVWVVPGERIAARLRP